MGHSRARKRAKAQVAKRVEARASAGVCLIEDGWNVYGDEGQLGVDGALRHGPNLERHNTRLARGLAGMDKKGTWRCASGLWVTVRVGIQEDLREIVDVDLLVVVALVLRV